MLSLLTQLAEGGHQVQMVFQVQLRQLDLGGLLPQQGLVQDVPAQVGQHVGHVPLKVGGHDDHKAHVVLKGEMSHLQTKQEHMRTDQRAPTPKQGLPQEALVRQMDWGLVHPSQQCALPP